MTLDKGPDRTPPPQGWEHPEAPCPRRGPGLAHTVRGYRGDPCVECGVPLWWPYPHENQAHPIIQVPPPLDVPARLAALGIGPKGEPNLDRDDDTPIEPKMARGSWHGDDYAPGAPDGPSWGRGRGDLSFWDKRRLGFVAWRNRNA